MWNSLEQIEADVVLVAIGRRPVTKGLGLEKIGVETDSKGRIIIDAEFNTSAKGVKCIGDVTFGPMLAHKAEEEGIAAVEFIHSGFGHINYGESLNSFNQRSGIKLNGISDSQVLSLRLSTHIPVRTTLLFVSLSLSL